NPLILHDALPIMADEKDSKWQCYIIPDLATWTGAAGSKPYTPIEFYDSYEQAAARFQELRSEPYNSEELPGARLTFGVQREDPPSAADLLHVRQGQNYLVDDYTRMASLKDRKSTRLNSSHVSISDAVFCLKKKETLPAAR